MTEKLTGQQVADAGLDDWRQLWARLCARFETGDFATGLALVNAIGAAAEAMDHHPDVDLRYGRVDVRLMSHDVQGLTVRDLRLASTISGLAADLGVTARPEALTFVEIGLDTPDLQQVRPFWKAVLGVEDVEWGGEVAEDLVDLGDAVPNLWFQGTEPHEEPRQRFHYDVHVPHDQAETRVQAAVAAGGTLVTDEFAPAFWVLADPQGNKACICTWQARD
ncbi:4a-hydroxytetrahydrobiopterin dehydratase [Auraticoccus monumenti]|uniref:Putative pterin-4-alpha-carbinolamine dehydratase n=1 Tax=Auraticoccus monumenti TaxID=675864 RepID=A0A1G7E8U8_9ACTN|nr:4a-hydroxytetrahydrobiopterin dehydratase [Auraticoccus monumenti]SDE60073.1 4a-hydroxytetrahydrobiopterin dehydratase [Auraticoccus monumenti]